MALLEGPNEGPCANALLLCKHPQRCSQTACPCQFAPKRIRVTVDLKGLSLPTEHMTSSEPSHLSN